MATAILWLESGNFEDIYAQNDKSLGQDGDGDNEASQSESTSEDNNQNSMCVSGDSTSLSCNNLSNQGIDPQGPQSVAGKIYEVIGPLTQSSLSATSDASCSLGDSAISGGFKTTVFGNDAQRGQMDIDSFMLDSDTWRVFLFDSANSGLIKVTAYAYCFDNP